MSIKLTMPELTELKPKISVIGIGGAGGNAVNNMIEAKLQGVEFVAANTDAQALSHSKANRKIQLGAEITQGLGAGSQPEVGRAAAEESIEAIEDALAGCHMAFVTAGMGGGTGTGAAPVVARQAREKGILTIGVVTKPFQFEGARRMAVAESGMQELQQYVDTLLIIPNQNLFRIANEKTTFQDAFHIADEVLHSGVRGITDLMVMPGLINLDFADVKTVMANMGKAMMGTGEAEGDNRAIEAAEAAISNPLLDETSMQGAKGVIINITGGEDLTLFEVDEAANHIRNQVDPDANIIVGSAYHESLSGRMRISVVATGIGDMAQFARRAKPEPITTVRGERLGLAVHFPGMVEEDPDAADVQIDVDEPPGDDQEEVYAVPIDDEAPVDHDAEAIEDAEVSDALQAAGQRMNYSDDTDDTDDTGEDPVEEKAAKVEAAIKDSFITPEATMPKEIEEEMQAPDPFAEADYTNSSLEKEDQTALTDKSAPVARGPSLFERMTGGFKSPYTKSSSEKPGEQSAVQDSDDMDDDEEEDDPVFFSNGNGVDLPGLSPEDRVIPAGDEDQLEIPKFLKRPNN